MKGLLAFDAGAASATGGITAFVARPRFGVIDTQCQSASYNVCFADVGVRGNDVEMGKCTFRHGIIHCLNEVGTTVRINDVITSVIGYQQFGKALTLSYSCCDGQHYPITKWYNGRFHIFFAVAPIGDSIGTPEQTAFEVFVDKSQINSDVGNTQSFAVHSGQWKLVVVMVATIVERYAEGDGVFFIVEQGNTVHSTADDDNRVFHIFIQIVFAELLLPFERGVTVF